jgi:hypothetical protein
MTMQPLLPRAAARILAHGTAILLALCATALPAQTEREPAPVDAPPGAIPRTVPEVSDHRLTSRLADLEVFLDGLAAYAPHADRIDPFSFGRSQEGRDLIAVDVRPLAPSGEPPLTALIVANIHGGEVEGKEVCQMLLREIACGEHADLLAELRLLVVPIFNVDGNERMAPANRASQNGPIGGVGERANAQGFDLNRDFVRLESPEARALLELMRRYDPDLLLDLHTTNGSHHGYQLTYAPSLSTNVDPALDRFGRDILLPEARRRLARQGLRIFDYGNLATLQDGTQQWRTFDHRPRFLTNYFGLRNRVAVLSEAYSYADFATRIRATHAFVLAVLRTASAHRGPLRAAITAADERALRAPEPLGIETALATAESLDVLLGEVDEIELDGDLGTRFAARDVARPMRMQVLRRFASSEHVPPPSFGWAVLPPNGAVAANLRRHGATAVRTATDLAPTPGTEVFAVAGRTRSRPFQGHRLVSITGTWTAAEDLELPAGTLLVPARQRLSMLAHQLLEPRSEDGLVTWNFFDEAAAAEDGRPWPVVRLARDPSDR